MAASLPVPTAQTPAIGYFIDVHGYYLFKKNQSEFFPSAQVSIPALWVRPYSVANETSRCMLSDVATGVRNFLASSKVAALRGFWDAVGRWRGGRRGREPGGRGDHRVCRREPRAGAGRRRRRRLRSGDGPARFRGLCGRHRPHVVPLRAAGPHGHCCATPPTKCPTLIRTRTPPTMHYRLAGCTAPGRDRKTACSVSCRAGASTQRSNLIVLLLLARRVVGSKLTSYDSW